MSLDHVSLKASKVHDHSHQPHKRPSALMQRWRRLQNKVEGYSRDIIGSKSRSRRDGIA